MQIKDIDDTKRSVQSSLFRGICFGFKASGKAAGSDRDWRNWRTDVGLIRLGADGITEIPTGKRTFTRRTAFLLLVRSKLNLICEQLEIKPPRGKAIDIFALEEIGDRWLALMGHETAELALRSLAGSTADVPGSKIEEVIQLWLGKRISLKTIRRRCEGKIEISTLRTYTGLEMQRIFYLVNQTK